MGYDDLVLRVEGRLRQTEQMQAAQRKDVLELTQLARGMAAHNAKLTLELGLREPTMDEQSVGPATGGTWEGSEAQRQELLNTAAWQAKSVELMREVERLQAGSADSILEAKLSMSRGRVQQLEGKLAELLEDRATEDGGCDNCDQGFTEWSCGEDTCHEIEACYHCNWNELRISWTDRLDLEGGEG
jgi:hypothetical protein